MTPPPSGRRAFAWNPGPDTVWALIALLAFWGCYYLGTRPGTSLVLSAGVLVVATALPAWVVFGLLRQGWDGLGITRRRLIASLIVSALLGGGSVMGLLQQLRPGTDLTAHLLANVLVLWEPLFVFGFLFLRWEKAFGFVAAPLLCAIGFFFQHVGAVPLEVAASFGAFGLFFGLVFAFTRNLFILWPFFYGVASAIGTAQSGYSFGWSDVWEGVLLLAAQAVVLGGVFWWSRERLLRSSTEPVGTT